VLSPSRGRNGERPGWFGWLLQNCASGRRSGPPRRRCAALKIATFNIIDINRRLAKLIAWLREARPDVACLQELKADQRRFPQAILRSEGYEAVWVGQRSWNGVAILAKGRQPVLTRTALPGDRGRRMRSCSRRRALPISACSTRAGPMRSGTCIHRSASTPSGTISGNDGRAMQASGWTTCC
jgi:hypothetical protein